MSGRTYSELSKAAVLVDVVAREVGARSSLPPFLGESGDFFPSFHLGAFRGDTDGSFRVLLGVTVVTPEGELFVTYEAVFEAAGWSADDLTDAMMLKFGQKTALPILLPFLRSEVLNMAAQVLRLNITMPLLAPKDFQFTRSSAKSSQKPLEV